jgi:hypothetical protein
VSDECPAEHIQLVYPEVRGAYLRALEVCDVQRRADQGGAAPPRAEGQTRLCLPGALHLQPRTERRSVQTRTRPRTREKGAEADGGRRSHPALRSESVDPKHRKARRSGVKKKARKRSLLRTTRYHQTTEEAGVQGDLRIFGRSYLDGALRNGQ